MLLGAHESYWCLYMGQQELFQEFNNNTLPGLDHILLLFEFACSNQLLEVVIERLDLTIVALISFLVCIYPQSKQPDLDISCFLSLLLHIVEISSFI